MKADVGAPVGTPVVKSGAGDFLRLPPFTAKIGGAAEYVVIPAGALLASLVLFGIFVALFGKNPLDLYFYMYQGAFGTWFSWQNTLTRAAPLILTALCTALPAQLGMVIIGGEGALLIGALCATSAALAIPGAPPLVVDIAMAVAGMIGGGLWIMLSGALRQYRGVNETISSLLLVYIALAILNFLVEGPMRDPTSLNKPSTPEIGAANMIGSIPGTDVHWGFMFGIIAAVLSYILIYHTVFGFAAGWSIAKFEFKVSPVCSKSRRCRAAPMPTSPRATASPAFLLRFLRGKILWPLFQLLSFLAASAPAVACCSGGLGYRTLPYWCWKA